MFDAFDLQDKTRKECQGEIQGDICEEMEKRVKTLCYHFVQYSILRQSSRNQQFVVWK